MARNILTVGSLFAGIGGVELGLERTGGFATAWQVEIDDYATKVLEKHWPSVRRWRDVRTFPCWPCDVLTFGSPCQGISNAGERRGLDDERSALFYEAMRCVRTIRPRYAIMENVAALLGRGMGEVLREFSESGYDAEWEAIPASAFGAPHGRDRVFIVAHAASAGRGHTHEIIERIACKTASEKHAARSRYWPGGAESSSTLPDRIWWCPDSELLRMVDGVPDQLDRYRCLGNAVVPQVAEWIGECILEHEKISRKENHGE